MNFEPVEEIMGGTNKWTCLYEFTNTGYTEHAITLPVCSEILVEAYCEVASYGREFTQVIPYDRLTSSKEVLYLGGGYAYVSGAAYYSYASINMSLSTVGVNSMHVNGGDYQDITTLRIYAR